MFIFIATISKIEELVHTMNLQGSDSSGLCELIICMFEHGDDAETNLIDVTEEESVTGDAFIAVDDQEELIEQGNEAQKEHA